MSNMYPPPQQPPFPPQPGFSQFGGVLYPNIDIGTIFSQSGKHFGRQLGVWVLATLIFLAVIVCFAFFAVILGIIPAIGSASSGSNTEFGVSSFASIFVLIFSVLGTCAIAVLSIVFNVNTYRNAVRAVQGEEVTIGDFYQLSGIGKSVVAAILTGLIIFLGYVACIIPGIVLSFILCFVPISVWAKPELSVGGALADSYETFKRNPGISIVIVLLTWLITSLAASVAVGMLFALPFVNLVLAITYFMIQQRPFAVLP